MNDAESKIKQQIIDKIKASANILVTVSRDPSVDDLTALIGLTAMMNKLGKHATAIFSGEIPAAISFLDPERVIENTADSLRDFIIALDKEKADHLRYKIEGDMVKIFITPYRTIISSSDLEFSQGDLNVELVLALGVENKDHLDSVLTSQNGIFHDATIVTLSDGVRKSDLGNIDWNDKNASCLSEMVASLAENFKPEKERTILDKQISTALLTGIVAATDRFSNIRTTAKAMTVSAQLIGAGADPQVVAAKLQEAHEIQELVPTEVPVSTVSSTEIDMPADLDVGNNYSTLPPEQKNNLVINHDEPEEAAPESTVQPESEASTLPQEEITNSTLPDESLVNTMPEQEISESASTIAPTIEPMPTISHMQESVSTVAPEPVLPQPSADIFAAAKPTMSPEDIIQTAIDSMPPNAAIEPTFGGTLNATAEQAAEDARKALEDERNKTTLTHAYLDGGTPESQTTAPINSASQMSPEDKSIDIFNETPDSGPAPVPVFDSMPTIQPPKPEDMPPLPPLPDLSAMMPPSIVSSYDVPAPNEMPLPNQPYAELPQMPSSTPTVPTPTPINDPSKFRIPGQ